MFGEFDVLRMFSRTSFSTLSVIWKKEQKHNKNVEHCRGCVLTPQIINQFKIYTTKHKLHSIRTSGLRVRTKNVMILTRRSWEFIGKRKISAKMDSLLSIWISKNKKIKKLHFLGIIFGIKNWQTLLSIAWKYESRQRDWFYCFFDRNNVKFMGFS